MNEASSTETLVSLAQRAKEHGCPWLTFREDITAPAELLRRLDLEELKAQGWFPWTLESGTATVITCRAPLPPEQLQAIRERLGVRELRFVLTRPQDLRRIVEHNQDVNPGFPPSAGRTPLAKVRTYLADRRSLFALYRTVMAKSKTNLALVRTGVSCITIGVVFIRFFGLHLLPFVVFEAPLIGLGSVLIVRNFFEYWGDRKTATVFPRCQGTTPAAGANVLEVDGQARLPRFRRSAVVPGARALRTAWESLSPVMRRRFLASDRTDFAEERTVLACHRTWMSNIRTALAFVRTGSTLAALGFGLMRSFAAGWWRFFDLTLVGSGLVMVAEGLFWYFRGYRAGNEAFLAAERCNAEPSVWDAFFPHQHRDTPPCPSCRPLPPLFRDSDHRPGIWATTGLALERTVLAERRNVMARIRTVMSRIRAGYSLVRTGLSIFFIGLVFAVYFHKSTFFWTFYEASTMLSGLVFIANGVLWIVPAERLRKQFPYCYADMEIEIPDYGKPRCTWKKVVFHREACT